MGANSFMLLGALAADWPRLSRLLDPGARQELRLRLTELRAATADERPETGADPHTDGGTGGGPDTDGGTGRGPDTDGGTGGGPDTAQRPDTDPDPDAVRRAAAARQTAADRAARVVLTALPADEAARLRQDGTAQRFTGPPATAEYQGYGALDLCLLVLDGNPMVGPVLGPVRERLLARPSLPWSADADPRLVVLSGADGRRLLPRFQFEAGSMPWQVVLEINALLRADTDPWGTADWWLSPSPWWDGTPAGLLGHGRDEELRGAARELATAEGEW
ncbi:hypothetical protein ACWC10_07710 [Streptomyces sp. NPDC001595]|uniref:hypothetical protein n=1 Tax=Streptomyces sp. NPDC001532 TaxID=3154520 RepID=UPI003318978D